MINNEDLILGIDLGGTNIKVALLNGEKEMLLQKLIPTEAHSDKEGHNWKKLIKTTVDGLRKEYQDKIESIGLSAPGIANEENTAIAHMPNKLLGLEDFHWGNFLGLPTTVLNDAHAALIAEFHIGAGVEYNNIVLITLGTGVGGGVIIEGKLLQGKKSRAGHIGHISIRQDGDLSVVGAPGSLENAIGECTVISRSHGHFQTTKDLVEAYREGDQFASWLWLSSVQHLARGISSLINTFSPELIIIGGGIAKAGDDLMLPLNRFMDVYEWRPGGYKTPIQFAKLGGFSGAVGAGIFAMEQQTLKK